MFSQNGDCDFHSCPINQHILVLWIPAVHAGMTNAGVIRIYRQQLIFQLFQTSSTVSFRNACKIHFQRIIY